MGKKKKKSKWQILLEQYVGLKIEVNSLRDERDRVQECENDPRREARLIQRIQEGERKLDRIEEAIDRIPDPMQRVVLHHRYIDCEFYQLPTWPEVAVRIYGDNDEKHLQKVSRLHGRALQSFEGIYKAIEKSHLQ